MFESKTDLALLHSKVNENLLFVVVICLWLFGYLFVRRVARKWKATLKSGESQPGQLRLQLAEYASLVGRMSLGSGVVVLLLGAFIGQGKVPIVSGAIVGCCFGAYFWYLGTKLLSRNRK